MAKNKVLLMVAESTKLWSLHLLLGTKIKNVIGFKFNLKRRIVQNGSHLIHIWNCYLVFINMSRPCPNVILVAKDKRMFLEFCIFLVKPRFIKETVHNLYNIFINIFWLKWVSARTIGCWNDFANFFELQSMKATRKEGVIPIQLWWDLSDLKVNCIKPVNPLWAQGSNMSGCNKRG